MLNLFNPRLAKLFSGIFAMCTLALTLVSCNDEPVVPNPDPEDRLNAESPRYMEYADSCIYFTCYYPLAVARFDTRQNTITGICLLGQYHPEGLAAVDSLLYIASSNISDERYNYSYDNKIYIVNINSFTLVDSVTVGVNPQKIKKLDNSHIVFNTWGDYRNNPGGTYIMDVNSRQITDLHIELTNFDVWNGDIYGYRTDWNDDGQSQPAYYRINGTTHEATPLLTSFSTRDNPYGINIDPSNGNIIILTDGNYTAKGDCYIFSNDGTLLMDAVQVGNFPSKAIAIGGNRLLVLNEGGWGQNNAGVSLVNTADTTAIANFFSAANGRGLGDIAQDMIVVGNMAYITVTFSNSLERMDISTGASSRFATTE